MTANNEIAERLRATLAKELKQNVKVITPEHTLRGDLGLNPVEILVTRFSIQENVILALVGITSFAVAIRSADWAGWTYASIGPLMAIHGAIFGKRIRLLAEKLALPVP